jgi:amino acid transporter/mannitol/fructose-specific phosphotransferase system IIA component (Ntr-type)
VSSTDSGPRLEKQLGLLDVYAICTGAMFSSGFFLLPGIAFARTGTSVVLAYLLAGLLAFPAMLSKAELSTAMPRAGGTYFYLDRTFGPLVGTVGGLGTWLAMIFKTAFAFVGIGVYLALVVELDSMQLSLLLTLAFLVLNLVGAKEASLVQRLLVVVLVAILGAFVAQGLWLSLSAPPPQEVAAPRFLNDGLAGLLSTVGLVFVSYAGLTKVASVAEEVHDPERNIPLGMALSLGTSMVIYCLGAYVLITLLEPASLAAPDLTPVASASGLVFTWASESTALILVLVAACGAFASTGNAALLSASRYLLALGRDGRVPALLAQVSRFKTPAWALLASAVAVVVSLLSLDVEAVAKLASAFQLLIFSVENLAVIVMRESQVEGYDPGFRSPFYPWVQIAGVVGPLFIIAELGHLAVLFSFGLVIAGAAWYYLYARSTEASSGAIYYLLARVVALHRDAMGRLSESLDEGVAADGLDLELRGIIGEKGLREQDPYDEVVARAFTLEGKAGCSYGELVGEAARLVAQRVKVDAEELAAGLLSKSPDGGLLVERGVALHHLRLMGLAHPELVLVRCREGIVLEQPGHPATGAEGTRCHAVIVLFSPEDDPGQHLRLLAHLALRIEAEDFLDDWLAAEGHHALHETLLRFRRFLSVRLAKEGQAAELIGKRLRQLELPETTLVAAIRRAGHVFFPRGESELAAGDRITIVGPPEAIDELERRWGR